MGNENKKENLSAQELADKAGVTRTTVYNRAKKLGRLPTVEELKTNNKPGRPKKYF